MVSVTESTRTLRRSYKFLLRPTGQQVGTLVHMLDLHREVYNAALEERREAWKRERVSVTLYNQSLQLTEVRKLRPDIGALNAQSCQQTLRRLDHAFQSFYREHVAAENRLAQAAFVCVACGFAANADHNAAVNILRAGLALREQSREAA